MGSTKDSRQRHLLRYALAAILVLLLQTPRLLGADAAADPPSATSTPATSTPSTSTPPKASLRALLDAPLLFVKRHAYMAGHIYDDYYTWHPGGGIYVVENPADPPEKQRVRAIIDPHTPETLGEGVYRDPELSWDAKRIVFAFKGEAGGDTCIYEIGVDGRGLRRLTEPGCPCENAQPERILGAGHHDVTPCYLPDGRIVFTSTRQGALVPCFNSRVDTLHIMNADGGNLHCLSANNVNEFDPAVLPDGRILYSRWEYVDKTALYMQSLWTIFPDGSGETALFANNLAKPTAVLDARPVPGTNLIAASFTPHNGQAVGAVVMIDPHLGKNNLAAVTNFTAEYPVKMDQGLRRGPSDPWPINKDVLLLANNAKGHGVIQIVHRDGRRELVHAEPDISCYAPMLVKPRPKPPIVSPRAEKSPTGRFLVTDIYRGLDGVEPGTIKRLRIVEETARTSGLPPGGRWWNQAFLVSWQGAYTVKNILGTVPVHEDGSAYFEAPAGRALYFEALDETGREVQRMRTFVQAVPGATRSCIGCHENRHTTAARTAAPPLAMLSEPARPEPESWGTGFIDYPTMVQPVLDKYCVRCHGGEEDMAKGLDFSGGWTWAFNISYETLIKNRLVGFLNCNNASVHTSVVLAPRTIGSGAAPLAEQLLKKRSKIPDRAIDLLLAWMDTNSNYYGSWDYTQYATCDAILKVRQPLAEAMRAAGCAECHVDGHVGNDWVNLQRPEWSRILRAPMPKKKGTLGLAMCRKRKARSGYPLITQRDQPPDFVRPTRQPEWDPSGKAHVSIASTDDPHYRAMLAAIRRVRAEALRRPRVDMPGAAVVGGECRRLAPMALPETAPPFSAEVLADGAVRLSWQRTAETVGLKYAIYRGAAPSFPISDTGKIGATTAGALIDGEAQAGRQAYALVVASETAQSRPAYAAIDVPKLPPPPTPSGLTARPFPGGIALDWEGPAAPNLRYYVYRSQAGASKPARLSEEPLACVGYVDVATEPGIQYAYVVRSVDRRGQESEPTTAAVAGPGKMIKEPVFTAPLERDAVARLLDGRSLAGSLHGKAKLADGALDLRTGGHATYPHVPEFDLRRGLSVECSVYFDQPGQMPVILSCGQWTQGGWFLQRLGATWRWYVAGTNCDGGKPAVGRWIHLLATCDGRTARLFQDGREVASAPCAPTSLPWSGPMFVGQYGPAPGSQYQVTGRIKGVKIYARAVSAEEAAAAAKGAER